MKTTAASFLNPMQELITENKNILDRITDTLSSTLSKAQRDQLNELVRVASIIGHTRACLTIAEDTLENELMTNK